MSANMLQHWREKHGTTAGSRFEAQYQQLLKGMDPAGESRYPEPIAVAEAVEQALSAPSPKRRYLVASMAGQARSAIARTIERAVEMNQDQRFTLDRQALIAILDSALAGQARVKH
jgi:hypothetical protein